MQERQPQPRLYHRTPFWLFLGALAAIVFFCCLFFLQPVKDIPDSAQLGRDDLLDIQKQQNAALREEAARLQELLAADPCSVQKQWRGPARQWTIDPGYTQNRAPQLGGAGSGGLAQGAEQPQQTQPVQPVQPMQPAQPTGPLEPLPQEQAPPASVGELMEQATVFILADVGDGISTGSGFFVAPGVIATNRHVVRSASSRVLIGNKAIGEMKLAEVFAVSEDPDLDFALLRVSGGLNRSLPFLQLAPAVSRATRISAWGYPGYISEIDPQLDALLQGNSSAVPEVVYSEGTVSVILDREPPVILHSASLSQGNSGGPLVNMQGVVVGINTFIRRAEASYSQANIALLSKNLAQFIQENGVSPSIAQ